MKAHLQHQAVKIRQLVEEYRSGRIVIPEFQRDYVWKKNKAPELVDSIYRGFPISSLLLWQSADPVRPRRRDPKPSRTNTVYWLIDGQQRIITLSRAFSGDEGIEVVYEPEADQFRLANAATQKDPRWVKIADLLDDTRYRGIRRSLDDSLSSDRKKEERYEAIRRVLDYEVPVVRMLGHSFDNAVNAFKRINTQGVRLKKEDIESAQVAARHSGFISEQVTPYLDDLRREGFNRLTVMHLFRACAFIAMPDGRRRTPLHELSEQEVHAAWKATRRATDTALDLVRSELGVVNMNVLTSGALLVPVVALCANLKAKDRSAKEIAGWLALAALSHRYSGSSETALDQDLRACRQPDPIGVLLKNLKGLRGALTAEADDFSGALNDKGGMFAAYIACMNKSAVDFFTGGNIRLSKNIDRHHILPRGQFPEALKHTADNVGNIAFVTAEVNRSINVSGPEVYLKRIKPTWLKSQCITTDEKLWSIDAAEIFWQERRELLAASFNDYIRRVLPGRRLGR